jgi:hypothetical protein
MRTATTWMILSIGVAMTAPLGAQPVPESDGALRIVITDVSGAVSARNSDEEPWTRVQPGQQFAEGVELRTGPKSVVKFDIPPDTSITLDRLGTVKVVRAAIENGTIKTDLGMKYGRARVDIDTASRPHDAQIRSPSSVLAVRGTDVILDDTPGFAPRAVSVTGRARFKDASGVTTQLGNTNAARPSVVESGTGGVADTALQQSIPQGPLNAGRTPNEVDLAVNIPPAAGLPPPPGGTTRLLQASATSPPPSPGGSVPNVPTVPDNFVDGSLAFELRWVGDADLQIGVVSALGEPVTTNPAAVLSQPDRGSGPIRTSAPSGGVASADARGGAGGSFVETITWPTAFPPGTYDYGVKYNTGAGSATYSLDVIVNGVRLDPQLNGTLTGPGQNEFEGETIELQPVDAPPVSSVQSLKKPAVGKAKPSGNKR